MPAAKKRAAKKKVLPVIKKVVCTAHKGDPCLSRVMMTDLILEALAATVWHHRDDITMTIEFVVSDLHLVLPEEGKKKGHFSLGVEVMRLDVEEYDKDDAMTMPLNKFLQTYIPAREINLHDCQA